MSFKCFVYVLCIEDFLTYVFIFLNLFDIFISIYSIWIFISLYFLLKDFKEMNEIFELNKFI